MKAVLQDKNTGHACGGERSIIVGGEDVGGEDSGGGPLSLSLNVRWYEQILCFFSKYYHTLLYPRVLPYSLACTL